MKQTTIAVLLVSCVVLVGFWEIMANRNRGLSAKFELTGDDLRDFVPRSERWNVRSFPVETTPLEPNIAALRLTEGEEGGRFFVVRLVHGYNMRDCMRIKGYAVDLVADTRLPASATGRLPLAAHSSLPPFLQVWRLTAATGDSSIWITSMLRTGDFSPTETDIRSMAFPRISVPDDPNWMPRGITLGSLRHPIRNLRMALRAKWNNARCDLLTFLGLRRPAWASEDLLTLVSLPGESFIPPGREEETMSRLAEAHQFVLGELHRWREEKLGES